MSKLTYEKDDLPIGWAVCKLENVTTNVNSGLASGKHNKSGKGVPHIRPMNIDYFGNIDLSVVKYVKENFKDKLQKNDVLFNNTNSPKLLGKTALIKENTNWTYSNHMTRIRANNSIIESSWLAIFLHKLFLDGFYKMVAKNHVNQSSINSMHLTTKIPIIISPLNEQKRIVSKIESIFAQIDAVQENLERLTSQTFAVSGNLAQLKNSVLKQAFEGKLIPQDLKDEPTEILLRRLHKDSEKELEFEKEGLPEGWVRTKIQNITDVIRGASPRPKGDPRYFGGNIPWIKISDITREKGKFLSLTKDHVTDEGMKKSRFLKKGSLILSNSGTVCIPKILNVSGCIHDGFVTFPTLSKNMNIFYAYYWFESIRPRIIHDNKQGVTQVNLNTAIVKNIEMLIPPLNEQHRIVSKIESIFANIDSIEKQVNDAICSLNTLKQSVLKLAFEGKLVPQDPNDEPASALLEKIKLQKK